MKKFNFVMQWLTIFLYVAMQPAIAGLPPTTSGGQSDAASTTFNFKTPLSQFTKTTGTTGLIETGNYNLLKNPGFEATTFSDGWTETGAGSIAVGATTNIGLGLKSLVWSASGAGETLVSEQVTIPNAYYGKNGELTCAIKFSTGSTDNTGEFFVYDGTNPVTTQVISLGSASSSQFLYKTINFTFPSSGTIGFRAVSGSDSDPIAFDDCYLGLARNVGSTQLTTEWVSYTPSLTTSGGGAITLNATSKTDPFGRWRRVGDSIEIEVGFKNGSGGAATGSAGTIQFSIPSGATIDPNKAVSTSAFAYSVGSGEVFPASSNFSPTNGVAYNGGILQLIKNGTSGSFTVADIVASFEIRMRVKYPVLGWAASTVVMPNAQGWFASGTISGANPSLTAGDVTTYTEITNASMTLTPDAGSAPMGIMCSSTNPAASPSASATICSAGDESVGAALNIPVSGVYEACFDFAHVVQLDSAETLFSVFNVIQTPTNAQTLTQEGGPRVQSGATAMTTSGTLTPVHPVNACGILTLSAGLNGIRLMYEQATGGTPNLSLIYGDSSASFGQRSIRVRVRPVNSQQQAILANSVSTGTVNGDKIGGAQLNCDSASSILRSRQSMIASIGNISSGVCSVTLTSGYFSAAPDCSASWNGDGSVTLNPYLICTTATACTLGTFSDAGAPQTVANIATTCIGPR